MQFSTTIKKFGSKGEKTGWTYIDIPRKIAEQLNPNTKTSFYVKGLLDNISIKQIALLPMGDGNFIMALNADIREKLKKTKGNNLIVKLVLDKSGYILNELLVQCLHDEPLAKNQFYSLTVSHQNYFSKWIDTAKTDVTKSKRIALVIEAQLKKWNYAEMIKANKKNLLS